MKKASLLSVLILVVAGYHAHAQTEEATKPVKTGNEWQMPKDVLTRAKSFTDGLRKSLGLDDATSKKVFDTYLSNSKAIDEIRMGPGSEREKKEALTANEQELDQKLKGMLSPEQFEKYRRDEKARKKIK
jgi:hypothetical protein